jgi:hypothetical protein
MTTPTPAPINLSNFTDTQLLAVKKDLEQRLARFQKAFFEKHGRNPNEEERVPAKPAITRYRAVCHELAARKNPASAAAANDSKAATSTSGVTLSVGEQVAQQGQVVGVTADAAREATRKAANAAISTPTPTTFMGKLSELVRMATPSAAMTDLLVSWGQFSAIFGEVTRSVTTRLEQDFPEVNLPNFAPWAASLEDSVFPYFNIFNLDIKQLQYAFDFEFLQVVGWRETHLAFTVLIPLVISGVTILLLRSLADIARLVLLAVSILLIIFGGAAYVILSVAATVSAISRGRDA